MKKVQGWVMILFGVGLIFLVISSMYQQAQYEDLQEDVAQLEISKWSMKQEDLWLRKALSEHAVAAYWSVTGEPCRESNTMNVGGGISMEVYASFRTPCPDDIPVNKILHLMLNNLNLDVVLEEAKPQGVKLEERE